MVRLAIPAPNADQPPFPLLPQQALATVHDVILALLPTLEAASGRQDQAEASLADPYASLSHWLAQQVNRDADLVEACADAEQQGYGEPSVLANLNRHPSPWRKQAQRCGVEQLPPDLLMVEAAALLAWALMRASIGVKP